MGRQRQTPGECIFCGGGDLTVEDVIPKGIARLFRTKGSVGRVNIAGQQETERRNHGVVFKVRGAVCRACNNGWMSGLQREAQPVLKALSAGDRPLILAPSAQRILVAWMTMTAMVMEWGDKRLPNQAYSHDERFGLREQRQVPTNSVAWVAQRLPMRNPAVAYVSKNLRIGRDPALAIPHNGVAFTAIISRLVMQLYFHRAEPAFPWAHFVHEADRPWAGFIIGMPQPSPVVWPPPRPLNEESVEVFAHRWKQWPPSPPPPSLSTFDPRA